MSELVNIDSFKSNFQKTSKYNTYTFDLTNANLCPNSFNTIISLPIPKYNVKKISLRSFILPVSFNSIRKTSNLNFIAVAESIDENGIYHNIYTIDLEDATYTSINDLLDDINTEFTLNYPTIGILFTLSDKNRIVVGGSLNSLLIVPSNLSYMLGFNKTTDFRVSFQDSGNCVISSFPYRLSIDDYLNMTIVNLTGSNNTNANLTLCSFKIPLNSINGVVYYNEPTNPQYISIHSSFQSIRELHVVFTDKFGYSLNSGGVDWSATLNLEYGIF